MSIRNVRLNLLPQEYRPAPTITVFPFIFGITVGLAILFMLITFILNQAKAEGLKVKIATTQSEIDRLKPAVSEYDGLMAAMSDLDKRKAMFAYLDRGYVDWAEFIVNLAPLVPENVWLFELKSQTDTKLLNTAEVTISGRTADKRILPISFFMKNLESVPYFTDISFSESTIQFIEERALQQFGINVNVRSPRSYDPPKKPAKANPDSKETAKPGATAGQTANANVAAANRGNT